VVILIILVITATVVIQTIQVLTLTDGVLMIMMEHRELEIPMLMVDNRGKLGLMTKVLTLTILILIILDHTLTTSTLTILETTHTM
jgi:hypothetical protein